MSMSVRVLVVDDSRFFRRRVAEILEASPQIQVIDVAENGREAIEKAVSLKPDVITMDIEMPEMDGISATREIMRRQPTKVLMFSTLTTDGAKATLDALDAGAADFLPKRFEDISSDREVAKKLLQERVVALGTGKSAPPPAGRRTTTAPTPAIPTKIPRGKKISLVAIGTSTGGPVALQEVLTKLPANFPAPIVLIQHMPGTFTPAFAERLNQVCQIRVKEAADGDSLEPGLALLAPGGKQMSVVNVAGRKLVKITESDPSQTYKPSVDLTYQSISKVYQGDVLAIVLTGMGADGREGARELKNTGSQVWSEAEETCVVYGMPAAVAEAGLSDLVLPLERIGTVLAEVTTK